MTIAARWSLSPNLISATETVSFSLMIGSASYSNSVRIVLRDVEVAGAVVEVAGGQEDLRGVNAVRGEALLVELHQSRLPDRGAGLEMRQVGGPLAETEFADARADGSRADQHDLPARRADAVQLVGERLDAVAIEPPGRVGQHVGADLDDDGVRPGDDFLANRIDHRASSRGRFPFIGWFSER